MGLVPKHKQRAPSQPSTLTTPPCSRLRTRRNLDARRPPARTHALGPGTGKSGGRPSTLLPRHAPAREPQPHHFHRRLSQGPSSRYRLEIATAPAGFTRPVAQPSAQCPPTACGGSVLAGTQTPDDHQRARKI